jgi:hypothetical protein
MLTAAGLLDCVRHEPGAAHLPPRGGGRDRGGASHVFCPALSGYNSAAIRGASRAEALEHLRAMVVMMVVEGFAEKGAPIPTAPADHLPASTERAVDTVCSPPA